MSRRLLYRPFVDFSTSEGGGPRFEGGCQPGGRVGTHRRGVTPETSFSEASGGWEERLEFVECASMVERGRASVDGG